MHLPLGPQFNCPHSMLPGVLGQLAFALVVREQRQSAHADAGSHMRQESFCVQLNCLHEQVVKLTAEKGPGMQITRNQSKATACDFSQLRRLKGFAAT